MSLRACRLLPATEMRLRRTPSMSPRNSCVMRNSLELTRSRVISSQRAMRCVTTWKRLHAAVCAIWIISKWVNRNNSRRNAALSLNSRRKSTMFIRIAVPPPCTTARKGETAAPSTTGTPIMPSEPTSPTSATRSPSTLVSIETKQSLGKYTCRIRAWGS